MTEMVNESPRVWVLCGPKAGDNNQMQALARMLEERYGCQIVFKHLSFRWFELLLHLLPLPSLAGLQPTAKASLHAPWPDLVITAGRRNELVARWIQAQAEHCRLVHLGRPWSNLSHFDLVVSTPQYVLGKSENILLNNLPLYHFDKQKLVQAGEHWANRLKELPRPYIVLLVGGDSGAFVFTPTLARTLAQAVNRVVRRLGGTLLVSSSARTPEPFLEMLMQSLDSPGYEYHWNDGKPDNPYLGYLALGDCFIVTSESVSMVSEAVSMGKPVLLCEVPSASDPHWYLHGSNLRWKPLTHRLAMGLAPKRFRRDIRNIQHRLVALGLVRWLGDGRQADLAEFCLLNTKQAGPPASTHSAQDELNLTARRVALLLDFPEQNPEQN